MFCQHKFSHRYLGQRLPHGVLQRLAISLVVLDILGGMAYMRADDNIYLNRRHRRKAIITHRVMDRKPVKSHIEPVALFI